VTATYNGGTPHDRTGGRGALEQQMNGVDNMLYMQSTNANDGTMQLSSRSTSRLIRTSTR
jgi:hypothetical protein